MRAHAYVRVWSRAYKGNFSFVEKTKNLVSTLIETTYH